MKKLFTLATVALLFIGSTFAQEGKKCAKGKACDKKECAKKVAENKNTKSTAALKKA